jgi:hypothetical protein
VRLIHSSQATACHFSLPHIPSAAKTRTACPFPAKKTGFSIEKNEGNRWREAEC